MLPAAAACAQDAPIPAPGQQVPDHAAGGWPTHTTDDDKIPARTPEQQARLDSVANELKRLANEHGPDSVVLQAKLLVRSMGAGAVGPTQVRVAGASASAGDHLEIDVETGLYFDASDTTLDSRRDQVWREVATPVLDEMVSFKIEPSALELIFLYNLQEFSGEADPTEASEREAFRVRMSREVLEDLVADRLAGDAIRTKVEFQPAALPAAAPVPVSD